MHRTQLGKIKTKTRRDFCRRFPFLCVLSRSVSPPATQLSSHQHSSQSMSNCSTGASAAAGISVLEMPKYESEAWDISEDDATI
jgi:hypothetical protein